MKAKEVLKILNITRPTLSKYVKDGLISVDSVVNGHYNYNEESVQALLVNQEPTKKSAGEFQDLVDSIEDILQVMVEIANLIAPLGQVSQSAVTRLKTAYNRIMKYKERTQ